MKISRSVKSGLVFLLLFFCSLTFAESPVVMLQGVADQMIAKLNANKAELKHHPSVIHRIVDEVLVPHIDTIRMAGMVVGRQAWNAAKPAERKQFVALFKKTVVNTYSSALASYDDDKIKIFRSRENEGGRFASVNSMITRKSGQKIGISYKLINTNAGWKVYDFSVEGVSIVSNYRSQFANQLANGGMAALNKRLSAR